MTATAPDAPARPEPSPTQPAARRPYRFFQPRNLAMWVYLFGVGLGGFSWISSLAGTVPAYSTGFAFALAVFTCYGALLWWFVHRLDRYSPLPGKLHAAAFAWGGLAATWVIAATANDALRSAYAKVLGGQWAMAWGAGLAAPFTEELAKGAGVLLLATMAPRQVRTAFDGLVLGAFSGLGFQVVEDVQYAMSSAASGFGADQLGNAGVTVVMRAALGLGGHIAYSAVFGAGLLLLLGRSGQPRRPWVGLGLMASVMLVHGVWDDLAGILAQAPYAAIPAWIVLVAGMLALAWLTHRLTVVPERAFLAGVLAPEVDAGTLTAQEASALAGSRRDRRRYRKRGRGARRVLTAAEDLATALAADTPPPDGTVEFARAEVHRLRAAGVAPAAASAP
jgi:Predicted membrane protein